MYHVNAAGWRDAICLAANFKKSSAAPRRLKIWLSGALARPFMLEAIGGLRNRQEALRVARTRAPDLTGLQGPCEVWLHAWSAEYGCLAVAVEQSLIDVAKAMATSAGWRLVSMEPAWNSALTVRLRERDRKLRLFVVQEPDALTVLDIGEVRIDFASTVSPLPDSARISAYLRRLAISRELDASAIEYAHLKDLSRTTTAGVEFLFRLHGEASSQ